MNTQDTRSAAVKFMRKLAADDSHGYDQIYRWGERGDYDCSSAVITAYEEAGVPVKTNGATYTGNMKSVFLRNGFKDVTKSVNLSTGEGLVAGDVLLNEVHHTAMYVGNGQEAEASINERGGISDGQPGDQTGREILIRSYRNYPWDCVLRYFGDENVSDSSSAEDVTITLTVEEVQLHDKNKSVWTVRTLLRGRGYRTEDGKLLRRSRLFDANTDYCVRAFQRKHNLEVDGIVGKNTWAKLIG